eukprot:443275-Lingulodinium_polyedra.AAC.1
MGTNTARCYAKQLHQLRRKSPEVAEKTQWQKKTKRVNALVMNREKGRALATLANNGERPSGTHAR